jgi:hypothetical protein
MHYHHYVLDPCLQVQSNFSRAQALWLTSLAPSLPDSVVWLSCLPVPRPDRPANFGNTTRYVLRRFPYTRASPSRASARLQAVRPPAYSSPFHRNPQRLIIVKAYLGQLFQSLELLALVGTRTKGGIEAAQPDTHKDILASSITGFHTNPLNRAPQR